MTKPVALIVEDEPDIAAIFAKAVQGAGFQTEIAYDAEAAFEWLASHTPHIVVLDLHLPREDGLTVLRYMRSEPRLEGAAVIIATAYPHMTEGLHDQAAWMLFKPISLSQLRGLAERFAPEAIRDDEEVEGD